MKGDLILRIEMIPATSIHLNLRNHLTPHQWSKLSKHVREQSNYTCEICKRIRGEGITKLDCHEVWDFNFETSTQTLKKLQTVCFECHCAIHMGFSYEETSIIDIQIVEHFLKVNNIEVIDYEAYVQDAVELYELRSKVNWVIDFSSVVEQYKEIIMTQNEKQKVLYAQINELLQKNRRITDKEMVAIIGSTYGLKRTIKQVRKDRELERIRNVFK